MRSDCWIACEPGAPSETGTVGKPDKIARDFGTVRAVGALSLEVRRGEILGLPGPDGAGQSTTVHLIGRPPAPRPRLERCSGPSGR